MKYRLLKEGEIVQAGDEASSCRCNGWFPVSALIGCRVYTENVGFLRRPILEPEPKFNIDYIRCQICEKKYTDADMLSFGGFRAIFSNPQSDHYKSLKDAFEDWKLIEESKKKDKEG